MIDLPNSFVAPVRVCHAGEDLDWLGFRSCCTAVNLSTEARILTNGEGHRSVYFDLVWAKMCQRYNLGLKKPEISITSKAPIASGLSTSSSLVLALTQACAAYAGLGKLTESDLAAISYEVEFDIDKGGGMDQLSIIRGNTLLMRGATIGLPTILDEVVWPKGLSILVLDSRERKDTSRHITSVRKQLSASDPNLQKYISITDECAELAFNAIKKSSLYELQLSMDQAHLAMRDLQGMSTEKIEVLRNIAIEVGMGGTKLTGAGGGGCLFGVVKAEDREIIAKELRNTCLSRGVEANVFIPEVQRQPL